MTNAECLKCGWVGCEEECPTGPIDLENSSEGDRIDVLVCPVCGAVVETL